MPLTHEQDTQLLRILNKHGWNYTVLEHHIPGISRRSLRRAWCLFELVQALAPLAPHLRALVLDDEQQEPSSARSSAP